MALAISVNVTIKDAKGHKSTVSVNLPSTLTALIDIKETATEFARLLSQVIGGTITAVGICLNAPLPGTLGVGSGDADVEEGAIFIYGTDGGFKTKHRIPTFLESMFLAGSRLVDLTDTDVINLVDFMEDGFTTTSPLLVEPSDTRDDDVLALDTAYELFLSSRPGGF